VPVFSPSATSFTEFVSGAAGLVVVVSGAFAGMARSVAVLRRLPAEDVDRATAIGFLAGAAIATMVLAGSLVGG
jgi:hypothetical protein